VLSAAAISCLSPGVVAPAVVSALLLFSALFIIIRQPYSLGQWKRPLANKACSLAICLLYIGASLTAADNKVNIYLPLPILLLDLAVLLYSGVISVS
jgi:hypothetical protein